MSNTRKASKTSPEQTQAPLPTVAHAPAGRRLIADTVGKRLLARREELGLKQAEVAIAIGLSRTAYCQYETGTSSVTTDKIERLARVLRTRPEWLAFGTKEPNGIEVVGWGGEDFERRDIWSMSEEWLSRRFNLPSWQMRIYVVEHPLPGYSVGEAVLIHQGAQPTSTAADYLFSIGQEVAVGSMTRVAKGEAFRIYGPNKTHEDVGADAVRIFGRVLVKI